MDLHLQDGESQSLRVEERERNRDKERKIVLFLTVLQLGVSFFRLLESFPVVVLGRSSETTRTRRDLGNRQTIASSVESSPSITLGFLL